MAGFVFLMVCRVLSVELDGGPRPFALAYVHNYAFFLSLSLGALFFVLLQYVTRSGWSVVVRRPAELIAANLLLMAMMFFPILGDLIVGNGAAYPWAVSVEKLSQMGGEAGHLLLAKRAYLNPTFFIARWAVYFAIWAGLGWWLWRRSLRQDESGDATLTLKMQAVSAPALVVYAVTVTMAAFDLLMSLDPAWFSTIFGVYYFAGAAVGFFAAIIIVIAGLQKRGYLVVSVTVEHYHDLGKWLFGFVFFWGYIAFSQYMLIWYGNIPEETGWFLRRGCAVNQPNVWSYVIMMLLVAHFIVPFVVLLLRQVKRRRSMLVFWAGWMLVFHWVDLYWLVMPELTTSRLPIGIAEVGCFVGLALIFAGGMVALANGRSLVPTGDPRLDESLAFENE